MEIRQATPADSDRIREIAEGSFQSSFQLSPEEIETLVENQFADPNLSERLDDNGRFLVAEDDVEGVEAVNGFIDVTQPGTVRWLHVDPTARGQGIGTALVERILDDRDDDDPLAWKTLEDAVEGGEFCTRFGLTEQGRDWLEIGGHEFPVTTHAEGERADRPNEPAVPIPETVHAGGEARPVESEEPIPGQDAPFFRLFTDEDRASAYGYFCSQCGSTNVNADGLDRLECSSCGNLHDADEWDGGYL
jgi:GNAT superfamily N-acetyltransferase/ribosomal protein S27AE